MGGVNGIGELKKFARKLKKLATPEFREKIARNLAEEALDLVEEGFSKGVDPYGQAWAPLKQERPRNKKAGGKPGSRILRNTGMLAKSIHVQSVTASGFRIGTGVVYAAVHNFGYKFPPRQQAAIRIGKGRIMFVKNDDSWSWDLARTKWKRILRKAGFKAKKGAQLPLSIGEVSKVFKVTVAPKIPKRQFLPKGRLPWSWNKALREAFGTAIRDALS